MHENLKLGGGSGKDRFDGGAIARPQLHEGARVKGTWRMECRGADGKVRWVEEWENIVVNQGLNGLLDVHLGAATQITAWYVGLKGTGAPAAADTPASHASWSELTNYTQGTRPAWTKDGAASGGSITNSAAPATYTINATVTINGAFLISNNTKAGTTGSFYAVGDFAAPRSLGNGDTLTVTATFTMVDDGI